ncbi:uncharacterized protein METZ01_LOCUS50357 [marine metagenome]|uniref:Uncharacterized protein n=1 Tax=marine metagenome TaxID=408172 RepID=A0A381S8S0_9ZZZZ
MSGAHLASDGFFQMMHLDQVVDTLLDEE